MFSAIHGHTFNCPAEIAEARYGLYVDRLALNEAAGGEGEHRGGRSIVLDYRVRANGCFLTCAYTRNKHPPWPLSGGRDGSPNYAEVICADGGVEEHAVVTALELSEGDVIRIRTGNGGGYGDRDAAGRISCSTISAKATSAWNRRGPSMACERSDGQEHLHCRIRVQECLAISISSISARARRCWYARRLRLRSSARTTYLRSASTFK
jgi:hypothetical protein